MAILEFLLETLVPSARLALPYVTSMVEEGLNSVEIQQELSRLGESVAPGFRGMRRTDLLSLIRGIKDIDLTRPYLSSVRNDLRPDPSRLAAPLTRTLRDFSFSVRLTGSDAETGEIREHFVTISTSELMSAGEIKRAALGLIPDLEGGDLGSGHLLGLENATASIHSGTTTL